MVAPAMVQLFLIALGGGLGAVARHLTGLLALRVFGPALPWGTLFVNVTGSFAMGLMVGLMLSRFSLPDGARLFLTTGLLGGFTTFSAFSADAVRLFTEIGIGPAAAYVIASVALSLGALVGGLALAQVWA